MTRDPSGCGRRDRGGSSIGHDATSTKVAPRPPASAWSASATSFARLPFGRADARPVERGRSRTMASTRRRFRRFVVPSARCRARRRDRPGLASERQQWWRAGRVPPFVAGMRRRVGLGTRPSACQIRASVADDHDRPVRRSPSGRAPRSARRRRIDVEAEELAEIAFTLVAQLAIPRSQRIVRGRTSTALLFVAWPSSVTVPVKLCVTNRSSFRSTSMAPLQFEVSTPSGWRGKVPSAIYWRTDQVGESTTSGRRRSTPEQGANHAVTFPHVRGGGGRHVGRRRGVTTRDLVAVRPVPSVTVAVKIFITVSPWRHAEPVGHLGPVPPGATAKFHRRPARPDPAPTSAASSSRQAEPLLVAPGPTLLVRLCGRGEHHRVQRVAEPFTVT